MSHKRLSHLLLLAGGIAGVGALGVLIDYARMLALRAVERPGMALRYWGLLVFLCLVAAVYGAALYQYMRISRRIGKNQSFCPRKRGQYAGHRLPDGRGRGHVGRTDDCASAAEQHWRRGGNAALCADVHGQRGDWPGGLCAYAAFAARYAIAGRQRPDHIRRDGRDSHRFGCDVGAAQK